MAALHSSFGDKESAMKHANELPYFGESKHYIYSYINHDFKEYDHEQRNLQINLQQHMFSVIDTLALLGNSYENTKNYQEALKMYFTIFDSIRYVFMEDDYVPAFYKVRDGNVYAFIARTYLSMGNTDECLNYLEKMVEAEIYHNHVEVKDFVVKNKYLDKANCTNYANWQSHNKKSSVLYALHLDCFNGIREDEKFKKIYEVAHKTFKDE